MLTTIKNRFLVFRDDECGAVTVDWVVLTAGIVGLGLLVATQVSTGLTTATGNLNTSISNAVPAPAGGTTGGTP